MFNLLYQHFLSKINISKEDFVWASSYFKPLKLKKKQFLLHAGEVCKYIAFVNHGALKAYNTNKNGIEHITQFALEGWWISDLNSFLTSESSIISIDAIEDCEVLLMDKASQDQLLDKLPQLEKFFRLLIQSSYVALHKRMLSSLSMTAEEKYLSMQKKYPDIFQRVPQHMIASFLGLKPETLSRVRRKLAEEDRQRFKK